MLNIYAPVDLNGKSIYKQHVIPSTAELQQSLKPILGKKMKVKATKDIFVCLYGTHYLIPKGFVSDGASLPWFATILLDRFNPKILLFSILHDLMYQSHIVPRFLADGIYELGLEITSNKLTAKTFYTVLRPFGIIAWENNKKKGLYDYDEARIRLLTHICNK